MKTPQKAVLILVCLFSLCTSTHAALVAADDNRFGPGSLTVDTGTGLTWLDISHSLNFSYQDAVAAMQPGGLFAGFRHATTNEVLSLYVSAGVVEGLIPQATPAGESVLALVLLTAGSGANEAVGITGSLTRDGMAVVAGMDYFTETGVPSYRVSATSPSLTYGLDTRGAGVGNWIVMVPEPSCCTLFLTVAALAWIARRRQTHQQR